MLLPAQLSAGRPTTWAPSNGAPSGEANATMRHQIDDSFMRAICASTSGAPEGRSSRLAHLPLWLMTVK